ncbi:hypothetical protein AVEN_227917-1 [Araneus ventricosus]|uniref:RNase H type-1 domain-containing protein n=1 Tax=Araneus ventricosus TaxID=182803 RepID=A0A4Y2QE50_ARAVE|nr:hypothetical protein AVEN_227917-1 [Araneus ventricosus]
MGVRFELDNNEKEFKKKSFALFHALVQSKNQLIYGKSGFFYLSGNELADNLARSATNSFNSPVPVNDVKKYVKSILHSKWQAQWDLKNTNKLQSIKRLIDCWPSLPIRKLDTVLTRLRIGHTRFTHRHLLLGEPAPLCTACQCQMTVLHILIECPRFDLQRIRCFHSSCMTLGDILHKDHHPQLFTFLRTIGFYSLI